MLLPVDVAALQSSRLLPHAQSAISTIAESRPAVVERVTFGEYAGPLTRERVIGHTFTRFNAGQMVRISLFGSAINAGGGTRGFAPAVLIEQQATWETLNINTQINQEGRYIAWQVDATLVMSPPNSDRATFSSRGQRLPPNDWLRMSGTLRMLATDALITDAALPTTVGGLFVTDAVGMFPSGSALVASDPNSPTLFTSALPVEISVSFAVGTDVTVQVQGGYMEVF